MVASLPHSLYRSDQVRDGERKIAEDLGVDMYTLMERAGAATYQCLRQYWSTAKTVLICCGSGNNAGDGYVIGRLALEDGLFVQLHSLVEPCSLTGDAATAKDAFEKAGGAISMSLDLRDPPDLMVDALFGTGLNRRIRGDYASVIQAMNATDAPCLAVDIPSGLCANTGSVFGCAIEADVTMSFVALKQGMFTGKARDHVGDVVFDGLGIDSAFEAAFPSSVTRLGKHRANAIEPQRKRTSHKGSVVRVMCIGGQQGMGGAILLCGQAALRSGAGLVSLLTAEANMPAILARQPELMTRHWKRSDGADVLDNILTWADVIAIGPGLGQSSWARQLFDGALATNLPMVLDADALHFLRQYPRRYANWVLTPHPGEAAKLLGISVSSIERDRFSAVKELQNRYGGVVVLKGAGTIVYDGSVFTVIDAGNPGMASGGMGDVLAGTIAACISQTKHIDRAAIFGTFLHSHSADIAVKQFGERGLIASDLLPLLGKKLA
ncbi:bifunctional ADP-dependent (S)-NAD(P)H-hydrate dehydratase/NAD(P)H-hydrate epimerase [Enterovibrio norvegicus]|uniref:bifunctional ADP-dependent NAD(P)H-hydrate dehydratase/NAD(P)H-hydrate epimerase n=1 Tax=Enterovibrio norvegicus TaxID=188144 RepID=UPI00030BD9D9|nr:bifunctional ADP-dependent NAD(P)H-hydrate dehydratase/NAD(P)H-hydrate epimerase [Enterovibrio norvegicus]OEE63580.1 bifunctional ADP-dependent (S)-NAD(P)H-hydrate dehydratase/NAD(P)H-hydrate epimerase [Enterovibrio norvegicus]